MKKAFSIVELILSLLFVCAFALLSFKLLHHNLSHFSNENSHKHLNLHSSFIFIEKILASCIKIELTKQSLSCLLEDKKNILLQRANQVFIGSSNVLLQDKNSNFYAPKAHFIFEVTENNSKNQRGVLAQQLMLQNRKGAFLYLYENQSGDIFTLKVLDDEKLEFLDSATFKGYFKLVLAKLKISLEQDKLIYEYTPYPLAQSTKSLILDGVESFELIQTQKNFELKICLFDKEPLCLNKESVLR